MDLSLIEQHIKQREKEILNFPELFQNPDAFINDFDEADFDGIDEDDSEATTPQTPPAKETEERHEDDFTAECGYDSSDDEIFAEAPVLRMLPSKKKALEDAKKEADKHKQRGNKFFKENNFKDAIHHYSEAIKHYDQDPVFFSNRALCYIKLNEFKLAENDCTKAIKLDIKCIKAYVRRATARRELKNLSGACRDLQTVVILEPTNPTVRMEFNFLRDKILMSQLED